MKILMLTYNMAGIGGSFIRAYSLAKSLVHLGYQVTLLASRRFPGRKRIKEEISGVRIIQMADWMPERVRHGGLSPFDVFGRLEHIRRMPYDLVHGFDHRPAVSIPALFARRRWHIPYVADWADLWGRGGIGDKRRYIIGKTMAYADHQLEQSVHRRADAATVVSHYLLERAKEMGIPEERIHLVQVGANIDVIRPLPKIAMRQKYGLPESVPIVVHIGFAPFDIPMLAATFIALARCNPRVILVLCGASFHSLDKAIEAAGLTERVRHLGAIPYERLEEVLACGDVMIMPYSRSTMNIARYPNRIGDYLAAGRPIATSRTCDPGILVESEKIGITADDDPETFAEAIQKLLADPDLCDEMGRRARLLAETRLSWQIIARQLDDLYQRLGRKFNVH
jgi:glycosyltransferase involved in cell wall biosynthesis